MTAWFSIAPRPTRPGPNAVSIRSYAWRFEARCYHRDMKRPDPEGLGGSAMLGLMQEWPLTVDKVIDHAKANFPRREVVTRSVDGPITSSNYATVWENA